MGRQYTTVGQPTAGRPTVAFRGRQTKNVGLRVLAYWPETRSNGLHDVFPQACTWVVHWGGGDNGTLHDGWLVGYTTTITYFAMALLQFFLALHNPNHHLPFTLMAIALWK
jgi:hypothetical protein